MGFLDRIKEALGGGGARPARPEGYWVYVQCARCKEPLRTRIDLSNDPSLADDGETYVVRKGLMGSGENRCFQTVEITLQFNANKSQVLDRQVSGGEFITSEEYQALLEQQRQPPQEQEDDA